MLKILKENTLFSRRQVCLAIISAATGLFSFSQFFGRHSPAAVKGIVKKGGKVMDLLPPILNGNMSLEQAIFIRRSKRSFSKKTLTKQQFSQIFWSGQGITEVGGFKRSAPSGGALYPADIYGLIGEKCVDGLSAGIYHYRPDKHSVVKIADGDRRKDLAFASLGQMWMANAALLIVITMEYERITVKYGERGIRYALIEAGHIAQNISLQCQSLGLSSGIVGAFNDRETAEVVKSGERYKPLIILPIG